MNDIIKELRLIESGLTGAQIIDRIQRGHIVRRSSWMENIFVHVCNYEDSEMKNGLIDYDPEESYYMIGTHGYFIHLGHSDQPYANVKALDSPLYGVQIADRRGEGIGCFFARDWEDYGYMTLHDFNVLRAKYKNRVREYIQNEIEKTLSIAEALAERM